MDEKENFVVYATVSLYNESQYGISIDGSVDIVIKSGFDTFKDAQEYIDYNSLINCKAGVYWGEL